MNKLFSYLKNIFLLLIFLQIAPSLLKNVKKQYSKLYETQTKVGMIKIKGVLSSSWKHRKYLTKYFKNDDIKAILVRIESPGGAAGTGQVLYQEIMRLKQEYPKPIVVLVENLCASAAYYVASATDWIICAPSSLVGSIGGYLPPQFKVKELLKEWRIDVDVISAGKYKTMGNPFTPTSEEQRAFMQDIADDAYEQFITDIATARKLSLTSADSWADGKIFTGRQAHQHKLVDYLGSYVDAIRWIKEHAPIKGRIEWVKPPKESLFKKWLQEDDDDDDDSLLSDLADAIIEKLYLRTAYSAIG